MRLESNRQFRYTPDCGEVPEGEDVFCGVCGDKMNEKRNCYGPRSWVMSMSGSKDHYDSFTCPNSQAMWHRQVVALRDDIARTSSAKIATLLEAEVDEILAARQETKSVGLLPRL